ncbi:hypothetical protein CXB51_032360 [Gossypium anomalum]|uniref:CCHC-type domain-containing protein n=1 Tax=Gossypium anomalum TaxID=47600 RepID=A0A8J5YCQ8_9ROSI|nr:hypothetical protein CXB51_032360 [Gossypium anomalum]
MVYGNYLTVQPWSRDFSTDKQHPSKIVVWMRMSGLPYRYYNKKLLRIIASTLGTVVKVNYNTTKSRRGKFVRFAIVVDLMKPIKAFVGINNVPFCVECEGLPLICYKCGCYGHLQERCPSERKEQEEARSVGSASRPSPPSIERIMAGQNCFGLWMQAPGWKQRPTKQLAANNYGKKRNGVTLASKNTHFDNLVDLDDTIIEESRDFGNANFSADKGSGNGKKRKKGNGKQKIRGADGVKKKRND